jgi:two-component system osmolarity sensor histidine kinase EnvZ
MANSEATQRAVETVRARALSFWRIIEKYWAWYVWRPISYFLPKRLYARSLIIVIAPMILLQSVVTLVFMERHWRMVTDRLSTAVVRDIAAIIDLSEDLPASDYADIVRIAAHRLDLDIEFLPPQPLPPLRPQPYFSILDASLSNELGTQIKRVYWLDTSAGDKLVEVRIQLDDKVLRVLIPRNAAYASNSHIFLVWMVGASLVLLTIAIPFLRNQVKPIAQLAEAAESFGKGRPMPPDFRPRGAEEVRRAGLAFIQMRERIERQIEQRTAMLTGVSHDLRTILTRFKLQLALSGSKPDIPALNEDVNDMQAMLEGYLAFARGAALEDPGRFDLAAYLDKLADEAKLRKRKLTTTLAGASEINVRPNSFSRMLANLTGNAFRYARNVDVKATHTRGVLRVVIDDDGPGIPEDQREEVFKPFVRLDAARNLDASGTGLGLSIARDIARSHGGDIQLDDSPMGGLRVMVRIPA